MPRPSGPLSSVFDPRWSSSMRPVADGFLPATCDVKRPGDPGGYALNRATGFDVPPASVAVLTGVACQVRLIGAEPDVPLAGEQRVTLRQYDVKLEVGSTGVRAEDVLTVTAVSGLGDPELVGRSLTVKSVAHTASMWTRLLRCEADEG